jgi:superfamily II DNA or RNA helicase
MAATSWCFTGVDAPKISCIILACSIGSLNTTTQQVGRGLRLAQNKSDCIIFDFKMPEKNLKQQFSSRMQFYKSEPEFVVKMFKYDSKKGFICSTQ